MPGVNFRRPKWCNFGMCAHLAFFCVDLRPFYTFFAMCFCIFCSFSWRIAKTTSDVQKRSHWEELLEKQAKEERPWDFWPPELRSARPLFGNKTPLTPAKPGVLFCLGNYATVYHLQGHFLEVKSCLFRPFFTRFTPLCDLMPLLPPLLHMWFQKSSSFWTQLPFFDWFLKVARKTATFQRLPLKILWRSRLFRYSGQELGGTGDHRRMALGDLKCCHT